MNYTLHQLKVFLVVTEVQSITKASEILNLSQPGVSIQLKNLQAQFEIPLTEVIGRQLYVTDFGKTIAESSKRILKEVEDIDFRSSAFKGKLSGKLKISIVSTAKYIMPFFLGSFLEKHPDISLDLDVTNKSKVIKSMEKNEVDFAMVSVLPENLLIEREYLLSNKLYLVGNKQQIGSIKNLSIDIFKKLPLIYREQGSGTRLVMEKYIQEKQLPVQMKTQLTSNEAVKQAVLAGIGCSIMPLIGIKNELLNDDLHIIPVEEFPIVSNWNLIWQKQKRFSPVAAAFLDHIRTNKEDIIKTHFSWYEKY